MRSPTVVFLVLAVFIWGEASSASKNREHDLVKRDLTGMMDMFKNMGGGGADVSTMMSGMKNGGGGGDMAKGIMSFFKGAMGGGQGMEGMKEALTSGKMDLSSIMGAFGGGGGGGKSGKGGKRGGKGGRNKGKNQDASAA